MTKNRFVRSVYSIAATSLLVLTFMAASSRRMSAQGPPPQSTAVTAMTDTVTAQENRKQDGHSYWKHPDYDSIIDFWMEKDGPHFRVHAINPDNPKVQDMVAKGAKKDVSELKPEDFTKAATYVSILQDMKLEKDGSWRGKLYVESRKEHFGLQVKLPHGDQKNLQIRGYIIEGWKRWVTLGNPGNVVGLTLEFTPVENPPAPGLYRNLPSAPVPATLPAVIPAPVPAGLSR